MLENEASLCQVLLGRARLVLLMMAGAGSSLMSGSGVAWSKSRCSGCEPVTLDAESFPDCPPGSLSFARAARRASAIMHAYSVSLIFPIWYNEG